MIFETMGSLLSGGGDGGSLFGGAGGGLETSSATASSGSPFTSGAITFGTDLTPNIKTMIVVGIIALAAIYLWKR